MSRHGITTSAAIIIAFAALLASARTRTTQSSLRGVRAPIEQLQADTAVTACSSGINPADITLRGFSKRKSDAKESFFVTNNTSTRISSIRLLLRYTSLAGQTLHERQVTIAVNLMPGDTRLVSVKTFDIQRQFYYYLNAKPRTSATPFKVAYRLIGYDIPVGQ